jgi:hypothetical protein
LGDNDPEDNIRLIIGLYHYKAQCIGKYFTLFKSSLIIPTTYTERSSVLALEVLAHDTTFLCGCLW